ncbi:TRAP transporter large permease subunit [Alloalcanivorax marinus]|uniref:TRAP transporter large permease subunit n=1 Tax=Alloalcanivorax marinus TaxID=1177169 RepID=UPI001932D30D|nr:TRAP transporter large permease subunit [Alloalcanivorax marinus]MBL7249507.1 TRAP transporter large permease subunit [Alloalcanivorax marinus]
MGKRPSALLHRSPQEWLSTLPVLLLLVLVVFLSSGQIIHSQLLKIGEATWEEYFLLRTAGLTPAPECDRDPNIDQRVNEIAERRKAEADSDPLGDLLGGGAVNRDAIRDSLLAARANCRDKWDRYQTVEEKVTPSVVTFRNIEGGLAALVATLGDYKRLLLALLLLICATTTTFQRHHIALRPSRTRKDHLISNLAQVASNSLLLVSALVYRASDLRAAQAGVTVDALYLHSVWIAGFAILTAAAVYQLVRPPRDLEEGGSWGKAFLTIPLFSFMCISASMQFYGQGYFHGVSVYMNMMMELSTLFLNLALYIWIGMMLKQTRLTHIVFDVMRPWNLSPELMSVVVLAFAAVLTAYTGASGIFVIAAGATIYRELIRVGARKQLALAATAMSGSMGVVLRPCLIVVVIAALNKNVTTAEMFSAGGKVFALSLLVFFIYSQFARTTPARIAPFAQALPASLKRMVPLMPYGIVVGAVALFFNDLLDRQLDEFSAPIILPVMLLAILIYEKLSRHVVHLFALFMAAMLVLSWQEVWHGYQALTAGAASPPGNPLPGNMAPQELEAMLWGDFWRNLMFMVFLLVTYLVPGDKDPHYAPEQGVAENFEGSMRFATSETTGHIGALLMLMAMSMGAAGIIERSGVLEALPETFGSIWIAAGFFVVALVLVGMFIDPLGAVILVNAAMAPMAEANGISSLHFWMIALVAFELGYLTPPVALNHLLTRQVVGDDEVESAKLKTGSFFRRYEKFLLPISVMLTALLIIAFLPLISDSVHGWLFQRIEAG